MKSLKLILIIISLGASFSFNYAQNVETEYIDKYGNCFIIPNSDLIPKPLTDEFIKKNLDGMDFKTQPYIPDLKFDYKISDFEKINRNNFKFRIDQNPRTDDIKTLLGYRGARYYKIKIKRKKNKIELIQVIYLYSVI